MADSEFGEADLEGAQRKRLGHRVLSLRDTFTSTDRYGLLLLMILLTYALDASRHSSTWVFSVVLFTQMVTLWLAIHTSEGHRLVRIIATILLIAAGIAAVLNLFLGRAHVPTFVYLVSLLLYFLAPWVILRHLLVRRVIDLQTLLGALSAYLLIGMFFAFFYQFLGAAQSGDFFGATGKGTPANYLFFSFTTLTTTGYGNLVPATNPGQSLAVLEMIVGQVFLIGAVGKVISQWRPLRRAGKGSSAAE